MMCFYTWCILIYYNIWRPKFTLSQVTEHLDHSPWIHWPFGWELKLSHAYRLHGIWSFGFLDILLQNQSETAALLDVVSKHATARNFVPIPHDLLQECHGPTFQRYLWVGEERPKVCFFVSYFSRNYIFK